MRGQTYRSRYRTVRQTQSNMADTNERADIQEQVQSRQSQSNMVDTSERADIQEHVQYRQADTSERADIQEEVQYRQSVTVQHGGHQGDGWDN